MRYKNSLIAPLTLYTAIYPLKSVQATDYDISALSSQFICSGGSSDTCTIHCDQKEEKEQLYNFDCGNVNNCYFQCEHPDCLGGITPGTVDASSANKLYVTVSGDNCMNGATVYTPSNGDATFSIDGAMQALQGLTVHSGTNTNNIHIKCMNEGAEVKEEKEECKSMFINATNADYLQIDVSMPYEEGTVYCPSHGSNDNPCIINANSGGTLVNINVYAMDGTPKGVTIIDNDDAKIEGVNVICDSGTSTYPFSDTSVCWNTASPTRNPTMYPTQKTTDPTKTPTNQPTFNPTNSPTKYPTKNPTKKPTQSPTKKPTHTPSRPPSNSPTKYPTKNPTKKPTQSPTKKPTHTPSRSPSNTPTKGPSQGSTKTPTAVTTHPSQYPTKSPSHKPSNNPTFTFNPSKYPTFNPSQHPTYNPSTKTKPTVTPLAATETLDTVSNDGNIWTVVGYLAAIALLLVIVCLVFVGMCFIKNICCVKSNVQVQRVITQTLSTQATTDTYQPGQMDVDTIPMINSNNNNAHVVAVKPVHPKRDSIVAGIYDTPEQVEMQPADGHGEGKSPLIPFSPFSSSDASAAGLFGTYKGKTKEYITVDNDAETRANYHDDIDAIMMVDACVEDDNYDNYNDRTKGFIGD